MNFRVDKDSEVPLHKQIAAQLVYLIGSGRLRSGAYLPSVRALAQRLGVHRNTVNRAFHDLTLNKLVEKRAGRRLAIRSAGGDVPSLTHDLDELIRVTLAEARRRGYSVQQLHDRLREHSFAAPPDHLVLLSDDAGMRLLLPRELRDRFTCRVDVCTPDELLSNPARGMGALVVSPPGHIPKIRHVLSPDRPAIPISYSPVEGPLAEIRQFQTPALIAVVSVSRYLLEMARNLLAPVIGRRHAMREYLVGGRSLAKLGGADFVVCDVITAPIVRPQFNADRVLIYRVLSDSCLEAIASGLKR